METVAVIGLGYVGLPLACLCAKRGFKTIAFDINEDLIHKLQEGKCYIKDKNVGQLFKEASASGEFFPSKSPKTLSEASIFLICAPTPINRKKEPDFAPLISAIETIAPFVNKQDVIVIESTVFPGTCEDVLAPLISKCTGFNCDGEVSLVYCPERVNPGDAFWSTQSIPRVIGGMDPDGTLRAADFYSKLLNGPIIDVSDIRKELTPKFNENEQASVNTKHVPVGTVTLMRSIRDAEAVKVMENTIRDVNIAFTNELAQISEALNIDMIDVIDGMSTKPFGKGPFFPGAGVGGHCIAVDPEWLYSASINAGYIPEIIRLSRQTNNSMPAYTVSLLEKAYDECGLSFENSKIAILGVAYKRNVDDARESPFFKIREILTEKGVKISVYDTWVKSENTAENLLETLKDVSGVVIVTDHDDLIDQFMNLDFKKFGIRVLVDGRNAIDRQTLPPEINYRGIGRRAKNNAERL